MITLHSKQCTPKPFMVLTVVHCTYYIICRFYCPRTFHSFALCFTRCPFFIFPFLLLPFYFCCWLFSTKKNNNIIFVCHENEFHLFSIINARILKCTIKNNVICSKLKYSAAFRWVECQFNQQTKCFLTKWSKRNVFTTKKNGHWMRYIRFIDHCACLLCFSYNKAVGQGMISLWCVIKEKRYGMDGSVKAYRYNM